MDTTRQNSTLALLRRLLLIADPSVPGYIPDSFVQLCDGICLYAALRIVAPSTFPPTTITSVTDDDGEESTQTLSLTSRTFEVDAQLRRANLSVLLRRVATYAQNTMRPSAAATPVTEGLDAAVLADEVGDREECDVAAAVPSPQLMQLAGVVVTLVVLSGVQVVLAEVKALPRQDQVVLSNWVRELMSVYDLKPHRPSAAGAGQAPSSGGSSPTHSAGSPPSSAQASPMRAAPVPSQPPAAAASAAVAPPPPAAAPAPAAAVPSVSAAAPRVVADQGEDEGFFRNATHQLRIELAEVKAQLTALQDENRLAKEDKETAERKYRLLLGEQAQTTGSAASTAMLTATTAGSAAAGDGESSVKEVVALWQERCSKKDETIAALTARVEEQSTQVAALKDAAAAHEMALQTLRRRLKSAEEGLMVKSEEKRETAEKLAVAEDKLAAQMKARMELENQVEELNSRVLVLTLEQERLQGLGNDETQQMNSSFASNGSVDRVMMLENELDEVRHQRDSLQRQVGILQRQVAAMPAPVADVSTANDTWRAQLRQVEREREDLRQQLTTALERTGELQHQLAAGAAAAAAAAVANLASPSSAAGAGNGGGSGGGAGAGPGNASATESAELEGSWASGAGVDSTGRRASGSVSGKTKDAARREQVILSSLLLQYSYRNLLLQQHETLLHKDSAEADAARRHQAEEHLEIANHTPASLLTRQRRDVEQGLLESVLHGAKLRMMRVEQ